MLDENDVVAAVCDHLAAHKFTIEQRLRTHEKGRDVIAVGRNGERLVIEAKGGTSSRAGSERHGRPFTAAQVIDRVSKGFFTAAEIRDGDREATVALAVPDTRDFRKYVGQIRRSLSDLGIRIFWVAEDRRITLEGA